MREWGGGVSADPLLSLQVWGKETLGSLQFPFSPHPFFSAGMVLCATSAEGKVEFVNPPEGAAVGERVTFPGHEGVAAEPNRMAKKKIFEAVAPELVVDDALRATWKGIPFTTTAGPCTVESAKGALIK